jgi:steroid 5-alpha reductase family enzyme
VRHDILPSDLCVCAEDGLLTSPALPTVVLNSPAVSLARPDRVYPPFGANFLDLAGVVVFAVGFFWESVGDMQKVGDFRLLCANDCSTCSSLETRPRVSRAQRVYGSFLGGFHHSLLMATTDERSHPPYFGEIVLQWGLWLLCREPPGGTTHFAS